MTDAKYTATAKGDIVTIRSESGRMTTVDVQAKTPAEAVRQAARINKGDDPQLMRDVRRLIARMGRGV